MTLTFSLSNLLSVRDWFQAHLQIRKEWDLGIKAAKKFPKGARHLWETFLNKILLKF